MTRLIFGIAYNSKGEYKTKALEWKDRIADNVFQALISWQP